MKFYLFAILLLFSSCKTLVLKSMLEDPVVETRSSIRNFQEKNNFSTKHSLILKADSSTAVEKLMLGLTVGYFVFNKNGELLCYNGNNTCAGMQFRSLLNNKNDSFKICNSNLTLQNILNETFDLQGNKVILTQFPKSDYYVISYWQKFLGGKKGYKETVLWMEEEMENNKSDKKFTLIKINTDLNEDWGLVAGEKARLKWFKKGKHSTLKITDIPVK